MKERPILFSAPMVRAIIAGNKTQTRRIVKPDSSWVRFYGGDKEKAMEGFHRDADKGSFWNASGDHWQCGDDPIYPNYQEGERLWVRETWRPYVRPDKCESGIVYAADMAKIKNFKASALWRIAQANKNHPSIHMPRWASRITLEITNVRVERLQDIGKDGRKAHDVLAEGITQEQIDHWGKWLHPDDAPAHTFGQLWESINGPGSWEANPWVWVITFKKL